MTASRFKIKEKFDLNMYGVRKAEGGARRTAYKTCFSNNDSGCDDYRPIFLVFERHKKKYMSNIITLFIADVMKNMV